MTLQLPRHLLAGALAAVVVLPWGAAGQEAAQFPRTISLDEAIQRSLAASPTAMAAEAAADNAALNVRQTLGAFLPSLNLGTTYATSSNERFDAATGRLVSENYSAAATGSYELFSFGRRFADRRAANARLDAALADETRQAFAVALETTQVYFQVASAVELVRVAEQRVERARAQLDFAQARLDLEAVPRSDVLRAEIELGNAELALIDARVSLTTSALSLGRQIGEEGEVYADGAALPTGAPDLPGLETLLPAARASAPTVLAAEAGVRDWNSQKLSAWTRYAPSLRVSGGYDWFAFDFPPSQRSWNIRLNLSIPVFDGFARENALARAQVQERLAEARLRDAYLAARVDVEDAYRRIEAAERRVEITRRGVDLASEDLRVQEERYQLGVTTILDLQTSQIALTDAENAWILERRSLGTALAQLEAVLGRTLQDIDR